MTKNQTEQINLQNLSKILLFTSFLENFLDLENDVILISQLYWIELNWIIFRIKPN